MNYENVPLLLEAHLDYSVGQLHQDSTIENSVFHWQPNHYAMRNIYHAPWSELIIKQKLAKSF